MTKKLSWRLGKLPTPEEIRGLVADKLLTNDEARDILFKSETEEDRDKLSLESEIKFLRELVEKLSKDKTQIVKVIREAPYYSQPWYQHYYGWCNAVGNIATIYTSGTNKVCATDGNITLNAIATAQSQVSGTTGNFSSIKTF